MRRLGCLVVLGMAAMVPSATFAAPPTLDHPGKNVRFISLAEVRAIALEHGKPGQPPLYFPEMSPAVTNSIVDDASCTRVLAGGKPGSKTIVVTGVPRGPRRAEYERNINQLLLNIECAYWNLYCSYWQLHTREQALRLAYETWKVARAKYKAGKIDDAVVAQAEGQYDLFRSQRLQALDTVLDNERQLWAMMGVPIKVETLLVPCDAPTLVEKKPDWEKALRHTGTHRPELRLAQRDVQLACWKVAKAKAACEVARSSKAATKREAELQQAGFQEERARQVLEDQGMKAERFLGLYYRRMSSAYFQIKAARAQREAFAKQLQIRYELYRVGANDLATQQGEPLNLLLESQRFWAEALATEYQAIVTYNNSVAGWEYAKGDIIKHAHVRLVNEALSGDDAIRAVKREQLRTWQHVRHEQAVAADAPVTAADASGYGGDGVHALSLVALWKSFPPLKEVGESLSSSDNPLVERKVSDIFASHRVHKNP
jgi:hypothetical protein